MNLLSKVGWRIWAASAMLMFPYEALAQAAGTPTNVNVCASAWNLVESNLVFYVLGYQEGNVPVEGGMRFTAFIAPPYGQWKDLNFCPYAYKPDEKGTIDSITWAWSVSGDTAPNPASGDTPIATFSNVSPGHGVFQITASGSGTYREQTFQFTESYTTSFSVVPVLKVDLVPNYDRDSDIDDVDRQHLSSNEVFRFWINDDDDAGYEEGSDIPGDGREDWKDSTWVPFLGTYRVDGVRDFVDFFPVYVDLKATLDVLGTTSYKYILKHADGAVNALLTDTLSAADADHHLIDNTFCTAHDDDELTHIDADGIELPTSFLNAVKNDGKGVVLLEGRSESTSPLVLEVRKSDDTLICSREMPLRLSTVEKMFCHLNLRSAAGGGTVGWATDTNQPSNWPDSLCQSKNLVFVHGYAPDFGETSMNGWLAESFKRFHWSGSKAKFHGVIWRAGEGDPMDYQLNVENGFQTASNFAAYVSGLSGTRVVVAHSLGNILVSSAIVDHSLSVDDYFLCDAAVASEAYAATVTQEVNMVHDWWTAYSNRTWSANWYQLFDSGNTRSVLTWRGRFGELPSLTRAINCYSTGDEVFELTDIPTLLEGVFDVDWWFVIPVLNTDFGRHSWQKQEIFKGARYTTGWASVGGTPHAGWGFNATWSEQPPGSGNYEILPVYTVAEANMAAVSQLHTNPVFRVYPDWLVGTNALSQAQQNEMLAIGIPALTPSTGRISLPVTVYGAVGVGQFDLNATDFKGDGWPDRGDPAFQDWKHNDLKAMAYVFTYKLFRKIVEEGGLE